MSHRSSLRDTMQRFASDAARAAGATEDPTPGRFPIDPEALLVLAAWLWPEGHAPLQAWSERHARLLLPGRAQSIARDTGLAAPRLPSRSSIRRRPHDAHLPANIWARARLIFGIGARAEIVRTLCSGLQGHHSIERIAFDADMSVRAIRNAAQDLAAARVVEGYAGRTSAITGTAMLHAIGPAPGLLHARDWRGLLRFLTAVDREADAADRDPHGLDDPDGELGARRRVRGAARLALIRPIAELADPEPFRELDPFRAIREQIERFLLDLDGW